MIEIYEIRTKVSSLILPNVVHCPGKCEIRFKHVIINIVLFSSKFLALLLQLLGKIPKK